MNTTRTKASRITILCMVVVAALGGRPNCSAQETDADATEQVLEPQAANDIVFSQEAPPSSPKIVDQPGFSMKCVQRPIELSFYTRFDYLQWNTRENGVVLNSENGTLYTLGYLLCKDAERVRVELFAGTVPHNDTTADDQPVHTSAEHIGGRIEYEYCWDIDFEGLPPFVFFAGIGTRAWNRTVYNGITPSEEIWAGSGQTWWTIYPYFGLEKHWLCNNGNDFYAAGRFGFTAFNYLYISDQPNVPAYYPQANITGQAELGWRRNHFFCSAYFEAMSWQKSLDVHYHGDTTSTMHHYPSTQMYVTGLKFGLTY